MTGRPWYAHYLDDYARDTAHLSLLEHGAYRLLLDCYYMFAKPLPKNHEEIFRICRAFRPDETAAVEKMLGEFFVLKPDGYHNQRADEEIVKAKKIIKNKKKAGKAGGIAARGKSGRKPNDKQIAGEIPDEIADAIPNELRNNAHPHPHPTKKKEVRTNTLFSAGNGSGNGTHSVTIEDPNERIARFQASIANQLGRDGWTIVTAACTPTSPEFKRSLAVCKQAARQLGKGWPRAWPVLA